MAAIRILTMHSTFTIPTEIPDYQAFMNPVLAICADRRVYSVSELAKKAAELLQLTDTQKQELTFKGTKTKAKDRAHWAAYYLKRAGCLVTPSRGMYQITEKGFELFQSQAYVDTNYLKRFPEFMAFLGKGRSSFNDIETGSNLSEIITVDKTPEESIGIAIEEHRQQIADEILDIIKTNVNPKDFELLLGKLFEALGYGEFQPTRYTNDEGIDGILKVDALGLELVYLQAKKYTNATIGRPEIQKFAGSLEGHRAKKGIFITTSTFSNDAKEYVKNIEKKIILIDGQHLTTLMIDHSVGVQVVQTYKLYKVDAEFFEPA
jgi:restriction system protein